MNLSEWINKLSELIKDSAAYEIPVALTLEEAKELLDMLVNKLISIDELRKELGMHESCTECKTGDSNKCQRDDYYSKYDFCNMIDSAIDSIKDRLTKECEICWHHYDNEETNKANDS